MQALGLPKCEEKEASASPPNTATAQLNFLFLKKRRSFFKKSFHYEGRSRQLVSHQVTQQTNLRREFKTSPQNLGSEAGIQMRSSFCKRQLQSQNKMNIELLPSWTNFYNFYSESGSLANFSVELYAVCEELVN